MATTDGIKSWIKELRTVRPLSSDAILVFTDTNSTRITLLDTACCIPAIEVKKSIEDIEYEDLASLIHLINHHH